MTEEELNVNVRLSCQRALLGAITPSLRMVTIGWDELKTLKIKAYFDRTPTEEDIEEMNIVSSEILCDIPFEKDEVVCVYDHSKRKDLGVLKWIVFARKEK